MAAEDRWPLNTGSFTLYFQKMWLLKTGDPLIEVNTWAGLTVYNGIEYRHQRQISFPDTCIFYLHM